jgi:hypothetical protein
VALVQPNATAFACRRAGKRGRNAKKTLRTFIQKTRVFPRFYIVF